MGFVGYSDRSQVNATARSFSPAQLFYVGPGRGVAGPGQCLQRNRALTAIEEGVARPDEENLYDPEVFDSLFETYGYDSGTVPQPNGIGFNADGTLFTTGVYVPDSVANFRGQGDPLTSTSFKSTTTTISRISPCRCR